MERACVQSDRLGLMGVADLVIETPERLAVIETKNSASGRRPKPGTLTRLRHMQCLRRRPWAGR